MSGFTPPPDLIAKIVKAHAKAFGGRPSEMITASDSEKWSQVLAEIAPDVAALVGPLGSAGQRLQGQSPEAVPVFPTPGEAYDRNVPTKSAR